MNRILWLFVLLLLMGVALLQYGQGFAVMPYPLNGAVGMEGQSMKQPAEGLEGRLQKHEAENIQDFNEIKKELARIEQQGIVITNEVSSWKVISLILFIFNLILFIIVWKALSPRQS